MLEDPARRCGGACPGNPGPAPQLQPLPRSVPTLVPVLKGAHRASVHAHHAPSLRGGGLTDGDPLAGGLCTSGLVPGLPRVRESGGCGRIVASADRTVFCARLYLLSQDCLAWPPGPEGKKHQNQPMCRAEPGLLIARHGAVVQRIPSGNPRIQNYSSGRAGSFVA